MIWQDRIRTNPYKRKITYSNGTTEEVSIEEIEGNVTQIGTPLNAKNMQDLDDRIGTFEKQVVNVSQFGAVGDGNTDDTEAIQNAITSVGFGGTVQFEKGKNYIVSSTIFVGIGQTLDFNFANIIPSATGTFTNDFVFSINSSDVKTWDNAYSSRTTIINKLIADNINLVENLKLMFAPCSLQVNWLFSRRFYGTFDPGEHYVDMYELNDINIVDNFGEGYAIYKRGQGDAFVINKMLVTRFLDNANMNAVSVGSTAGCQLNDVIGGNYLFYNSRNVSINNAHIEVGRISIKNSQVVINNTYLWKDGNNSTIELSDSTISSSKDINLPVVLNNVIFKVRNIKYDYVKDYGDIDITNFNGLLELNNVVRINEINSNNYAYESVTGISIKTGTDSFIYTVDNNTYIRNKIIEPIRKIFTTLATGYYTLISCSAFESDKAWQATADKEFFYKVLVLNDTERMCGINETNVTSTCVKSAIPSSTQNVLLNLGKVAGMSLRILRGSSLTTFEEYVDIPFCQSRVLVDTGSCVNGFEWKTNSSGTYPTINNISSEDFVTNFDGNVCCYGKEKPSVGTWKAGDRVYDITGATNGWRCTTAGTPGTWIEI